MAENVRPPVAIRIVRPYQTEDEFLENELETVGKTSVILIGAHARPTGVILRFEVTLASGATLLRGEGRVLAHKETAFRGQPGLSLRFTRLDPRSKALVDRAASLREARASGDPTAMASRRSSPPSGPEIALPSAPSAPGPSARPSRPPPARSQRPDPALASALTAETPAPRPASIAPPPEDAPTHVETRSERPPPWMPEPTRAGVSAPPPLPVPDPPPPVPVPVSAPPVALARVAAPASAAGRRLAPPEHRDELLGRLRERAARLPRERVEEILTPRR